MLKAFIKDLSDVDKELQGFYVKAENGYTLGVEEVDGYSLENFVGMKSSIARMKNENQDLKSTLGQFGELDPKDTLKKLKRYDEIKDKNIEKIKKDLGLELREEVETEFKNVIGEKDKLIASLTGGIKKAARGKIETAIAKAGGTPEFAKSYIDSITDVEITEEGYRLKILGENGKERFKVEPNGNTNPFGADDLVKELQKHEVFGKMFPAGGKSGSGGPSKMEKGQHQDVKTITSEQAASGEYIKELSEGSVRVAE